MATTTEPQDNLFTLTLPKPSKEDQVLKLIEDSTTTRAGPTTTLLSETTAMGLSAIEALLPESTTTAKPTSTLPSPLSDASVSVSKEVPTTTGAGSTSTAAPTTTQLTSDVTALQKRVADLEAVIVKMVTTTVPSQVDLRSIFPSGGGRRSRQRRSKRSKRALGKSKKRSRK